MKITAFFMVIVAVLATGGVNGQIPAMRTGETAGCWSCHAGGCCSCCHDHGRAYQAEDDGDLIGGGLADGFSPVWREGGSTRPVPPGEEYPVELPADDENPGAGTAPRMDGGSAEKFAGTRYGQGMSGWCDYCHSIPQSERKGSVRHPDQSDASPGIASIMCNSCHGAHAGGFGQSLYMESTVVLLLDEECKDHHEDGVSGPCFDTPPATYAAYQRVLCKRCHGNDQAPLHLPD